MKWINTQKAEKVRKARKKEDDKVDLSAVYAMLAEGVKALTSQLQTELVHTSGGRLDMRCSDVSRIHFDDGSRRVYTSRASTAQRPQCLCGQIHGVVI